MRFLVATLALAAALSVAVTLAVAAPGALSPTRSAAAAEYCPPGELDARTAAVRRARTRLARAKAALVTFRATQLRLRARAAAGTRASLATKQDRAYAVRVRNLRALEAQLKRAQARLSRCD